MADNYIGSGDPALQSHEVMVFLAREAAEATTRSRLIFRAMAAWFGIVAVAQLDFTLFHSYEENRAGFIASTLTMKFVASAWGVNVPTTLGILAIAIMAALSLARDADRERLEATGFVDPGLRLAVTCWGAVVGMTQTPYFFQPSLQFEARNYGAFISLPLAAISSRTRAARRRRCRGGGV